VLPILELGPIHLGTYRVLYALGVLVAGLLSLRRLVKGGVPDRLALRGWILTIWGGLLGSWLLHQVVVQVHVLALAGRLVPPVRGTTIMGGLLGGTVVALVLCRRWDLPTGRVLDLGAVPIPLGQAIGRVGCLAAGCCHGRATDSWLGLRLPDAHGTWALRYPTQMLSSAADLLIFLTLIAIERGSRRHAATGGWRFPGFLFLLFVLLYCGKRLLIEVLRVSRPPVLGPLTWAQVVAALGLVVAGVLMAWRFRSSRM